MINRLALFFALLSSTFSFGQVSPWGTGSISNQSLNQLADTAAYISHTFDSVNFPFQLNQYLTNHTFNMYIPPSYDGSEPYGIVSFINSGNNGHIFNSWIPVLDEKKLIMVSGNGIGNSVFVVDRMGVALAGAKSLIETLNIDTNRIYASGNSGGARSCASMIFFFPEVFTGMLANCGSAYLRRVSQDYETHQPNSHYEYNIFPFGPNHLEHVRSFDHTYAMMTSYDDFREGDIMNIYHNGMEPDGFKSKILETTGPHCATTTQHFRDAVNFVEHPHLDIVRDSFDLSTSVGTGFKLENAAKLNNKLVLSHNQDSIASAYSNDPFLWNDEEGAIIRTQFTVNPATFNNNTKVNIGLADMVNQVIFDQVIGQSILDSIPNLLISVDFDTVVPFVTIEASNGLSTDTLIHGLMADWTPIDTFDVKLFAWNNEVRVEFSNHFHGTPITSNITKLLDDNRSVRITTNGTYWSPTDFASGTLLTLVSEQIDPNMNSTDVSFNFVEVVAADSIQCNSLSNRTRTDSIVACDEYTWIDGNTYYASDSTATYLTSDSSGCDSTISLYLTIDNINSSVNQTFDTLEATQQNAQYQWINCSDLSPIAGETNSIFVASENGEYAVVVTNNSCSDTSSCYSVTGLGLSTNLESSIQVYPNPHAGKFNIEISNDLEQVIISLYNLQGQLLLKRALSGGQQHELELNTSPGIYTMVIESEETKFVKRIIQQ